jgi:hypothetical protein
MANDDIPRGLIPLNLNRPSQVHYYRANTGNDIYIGDLVILADSGYVTKASDNTAMVPALGVAVGFAGTKKAGLAGTDPFFDGSDFAPPTPTSDTGDRYVAVADDPNIEFLVQEDTGGTALTLADVGASCDLIHRTTVGNTDSGWANLELDASDIAATTGGSMMILRLADLVNSDGSENAVGDYAKWVVRILHHQKLGGNYSPVA